MAIKTFTTGEVLTASDTNTYLANSGLVYVTSATVGTGVSSVTVSNAFSATYDRYLVTIDGIVGSAGGDFRFQLGSAASQYYGIYNYQISTGTSNTFYQNATANAYIGGFDTIGDQSINFDIINPYKTVRTTWTGQAFGNNYYFNFGYQLADTTSYTAFTISTGSATTLTGGTITVYGYRKA